MNKKSMLKTKNDRKYITKICELLSAIYIKIEKYFIILLAFFIVGSLGGVVMVNLMGMN